MQSQVLLEPHPRGTGRQWAEPSNAFKLCKEQIARTADKQARCIACKIALIVQDAKEVACGLRVSTFLALWGDDARSIWQRTVRRTILMLKVPA